MYPEEVPQSWYELVKPTKLVQEIPKEPFGINLGVPRNTRNTQNVNPLFEPTFGGWKDDTELDRGANYLVFKDLDRKRKDVPSSPVLSVQRREIPPLKKANIGQTSKPHEETKQEEFTLVKGVPDWFLKQVKPDLFQGYKNSTRSGNKTFKPPSSNSRNWVLIRDPKSKKPQMVSLLSKTQKMKLQRKYSLFQSGESSTGEESGRGARPNPRFNRAQRDSEEEFRIQFREEETLKKVAFTMLEEDLDPPSPNSLDSYQSGLLEAMLVEQGGIEGSSSPMEVSTQKVESKETVKEETVKPTKEVSSIQFGSQPEVQVNMVYPCSMNFFKNGQTSRKQDDTWLNLSKSDISEDTRSDDELTIICNDCDLEEVAQIEMDENLVCEIEQNQESLEVSSKEVLVLCQIRCKEVSVEGVKADPHPFSAIANFAEAEMYKSDVVPLSELLQAAT
ncbi:hypothetical protein RHGRI_016832 [Rhododendron griersonianum]|uniref:Uncharacterized protein n=1 Tax=Rhododendron griersonianum TaxID=479676 RepID=A0AAV6JVM3_9ERIC|nr:hypothetical protein RHGRI_016832 [Rhododendron griersonianum]